MARYMDDEPGASGPARVVTPPPPPPPRRVVRAKKRSSGGSSRSSGGTNYRQQSYARKSSGGSNRSISRSTPRTTNSNAKVVKPVAPPKPPPPPSSSVYLKSDSTYQRQLAAYAKALSDFSAEQGLSKADYNTNYANTRRDIGLAKEDASTNLENDYASRGLLRSSLYNTDVGKLNQEYQNQYTDLDKQRTAFLDQLTQQLTGYKNEQATQSQNAMSEALRRRAEKYNL